MLILYVFVDFFCISNFTACHHRCTLPEFVISQLKPTWTPPAPALGWKEGFGHSILFDVQVLRTMLTDWDKVGVRVRCCVL